MYCCSSEHEFNFRKWPKKGKKKKKHKQKTKYTIQLSSHKAFWSFYHKITVLIKSISQSIPRRAL